MGHLPVVGRGINCNVSGLGKSGDAGETKEGEPDEGDFAKRVRADAYCDHNGDNHHKHSPCHPQKAKLPLATPLNRPNSVASRPHHVHLKQARHPDSLRVTVWLLLGATLIVVLAARIRLLGLPLERDEGEYAYSGQLLLQGIPPYQLAYSMKFPGTSVAYALLMSIFGDSITAIHVGLITVNLGTTIFILLIGRRLLGEIGGTAAAATFSVLTLMP